MSWLLWFFPSCGWGNEVKTILMIEQEDPRAHVAACRAKLYASEMGCRVTDRVLQIFGGMGYMTELPIERFYRDARAFRIGEGTSEMQRIQIARAAFAASGGRHGI